MSINYYFSEFDKEKGFSEKLAKLLRKDIKKRKLFVYICTNPDQFEETNKYFRDNITWFVEEGIMFQLYHIVDYRVKKEEAELLIKNASVIFLCGGDPFAQDEFLEEYELKDLIKNCDGVVMGISAGAINMAEKSLCTRDEDIKETIVYDGIGLDDITVDPHFSPDKLELIENDLFPLSNEMKIYGLCDEGVIRVKDNKLDFLGDIYLISNSNIEKIEATL